MSESVEPNKKTSKDKLFESLLNLSKILPLAYVVLIGYSVVGQFFYYRTFNFPIFTFLNLQDLVVLSFIDIPGAIYATIIVFVVSYIFEVVSRILTLLIVGFVNLIKYLRKKETTEVPKFSDMSLTKNGLGLSLLVVALVSILLEPFGSLIQWVVVFWNFILAALILFRVNSLNPKAFVSIMIVLLFQYQAIIKSPAVKKIKGGKYQKIELITKSGEMVSDSSLVYVGKTLNYVFLLDTTSHSVTAKSLGEIEEIRFYFSQ